MDLKNGAISRPWDVLYRPLRFADVLGQGANVRILTELLRKGRIRGGSYIFSGPFGGGKTTLARILVRAMLCQNLGPDCEPCNECPACLDVIEDRSLVYTEMNAANDGNKENIERIIGTLMYESAGQRVWLFDEAHRLSTAAMNALLKPIEDDVASTGHKKLVCLFCTTEPEAFPPALRSRCLEISIRRVTDEDVAKRLEWIAGKEGVTYDAEALRLIAACHDGHVRPAILSLYATSLLGQVTVEVVRQHLGLDVAEVGYDILERALADDLGGSLRAAEEAADRAGAYQVIASVVDAISAGVRASVGSTAGMSPIIVPRAKALWGARGSALLALADDIRRWRPASRSTLACDVARIHGWMVGTLSAGGAVARPQAKPPNGAAAGPQSVQQQESVGQFAGQIAVPANRVGLGANVQTAIVPLMGDQSRLSDEDRPMPVPLWKTAFAELWGNP